MFAADGGVAESSQSGTPQGEGKNVNQTDQVLSSLISVAVVVYAMVSLYV